MFDVAGVFAGMLVLAAFVIGIDFLVTVVERRLLVWRPVAAKRAPDRFAAARRRPITAATTTASGAARRRSA